MRAIESAVPFGFVGVVQANESKHAFNLFDLMIEFATKSCAGACFTKLKEKHASVNSIGVNVKTHLVGI